MKDVNITLVGDGVENPHNAGVMQAAARLMKTECAFIDRCGLGDAWEVVHGELAHPPCIAVEDLESGFDHRVAVENTDGASPVFGHKLPAGVHAALVVGNERRGVSRRVVAGAAHAVEIPMVSRRVNCLNVAAASAVALYYLSRGGGGRLRRRNRPGRLRPNILLAGGRDHVEIGSSIRSAAALGWEIAMIEDPHGVWFGSERFRRAEGRAAARKSKNPIRLLSAKPGQRYGFERAVVVTAGAGDRPLSRVNLARGPDQVLILVDEAEGLADQKDWSRVSEDATMAGLDLDTSEARPHLRLTATIALAEASRQIGLSPGSSRVRARRGRPRYERALQLFDGAEAHALCLEDLLEY